MDLTKKILIGGALCGTLAFNTKAINEANALLKDSNAPIEQRSRAEGTKADAEMLNLGILISAAAVGMGKIVKKYSKPNDYDVATDNSLNMNAAMRAGSSR